MADQPSNYYVICDRCGGKFHIRETRKTWDNLLVCSPCWEPRNELDFVKAKLDDISVPIARPDVTNTIYHTTLAADADSGDNFIVPVAFTHISTGSAVGVTLNDGRVQWFQVTNNVTHLTFTEGSLAGPAAAGNKVYTNYASGGNFI